jgi:hypothetical protein
MHACMLLCTCAASVFPDSDFPPLAGKTLEDVEVSTTIEEVQYKIEDQEGVPTGEQRLLLGGVGQLQDDLTLADYNIQAEAT